ncbi:MULTISPECIES: TonB-dependent receptor [Flavobacterium]|uniref:Carboxypeptidase-like regulatory domain-containing protein n=1 Tax=Flavobacterium hankyongi TaxID=1176532 RepID=A0ABP8ZU92_9FLAO|nr:TonB-dependent receptor [Flavobacterium sp. N1846]
MNKFQLLLILLFFNLTYSQENKISLEYSNQNYRSIIQKIEQASPYRFFYDDRWIDDTKYFSNEFKNKSIDQILNQIFEDSDINFFIDSNRIILTQKILIHDKLADSFYKKENNDKQLSSKPSPVFYQEYNSSKTQLDSISLIGKESKDNYSKGSNFKLTGTIKNKKSNEFIPDVNISIKKLGINTISDDQGNFELNLPPGIHTVSFSIQGFKSNTKKIIVYNNGKLNINLTESATLLSEVVIKGKNKQKLRTAITGVTTIEAEGVKTVPLVFGERDVLKIATTTPGIKTAGEGSAGYNVRGGKEDQNLFILDKGTIYNPSHFFGLFSALNPYIVKKVDIYKGSIPTEFGGRLSSVFDISSKNGNVEKLSGEGGIGPVTSNLAVSIPVIKNKASLLIGGRGTYSGWILKSLDEEKLKNSKASFYDFSTRYSHKINDNNSIESTIYYSNDKFNITADSLFSYNNRLVTLNWKHKFNDKNASEITLTNSKYNFTINYSGIPQNSFKFGYTNNETQFQIKLIKTLNEKNRLSYGIQSKIYKIEPGYIFGNTENSNIQSKNINTEKGLESALYISDNYKISDKLLFDIGVRYSIYNALGPSIQKSYAQDQPRGQGTQTGETTYKNNEFFKTYHGFEPRLALRYSINSSLSIKGSYDKTFQYIHLLSTNTTQSPTDTWKLSNNNIKPQSGEQFSVGIFKNLDPNNIEISTEFYYKKSKNILDYKVGANLVMNEYLETELLQGNGKSYGAELLIKKKEGRLNGWLSYTYSRSFIKLDGQFDEEKVNNGKFFPTNFDKPHDLNLILNYKLTMRYSFSGNFTYQTGRPVTYPVGKYTYNGNEYPVYSDRNAFRIPDYYRLDLGINIEGNHKIKKLAHSFWNISVYNVLGRNNPYSVYFVTKNGEIKGYKTTIFNVPVPTVTYNFKF